jgi:hypothetical protein
MLARSFWRMKDVLSRMNQPYSEFQVDTLEPMIILGGCISNFSQNTGTYVERIIGYLNKMSEPEVKIDNPEYKSTKQNVDRYLDRLTAHAGEVGT